MRQSDALPLLPRVRIGRRSPLADLLVLGLVLVIAAGFRVHGLLSWDDTSHQHPDERFLTDVATKVATPTSLAEYFNTQRASLNPYARGYDRYAYGQLPLTLTRFGAEWTANTDYDSINRVGRALSTLADLGTILFTWLLARRVFGVRCAHLAALLLSVTVLHIQLAHFFAVDTFVACFAAAALLFGQRAWQRDNLVDALLAGAMTGLAVASKFSALMLLPVLGLAFVWPRSGRRSRAQLLDGCTAFGVTLVGTFVVFRLAEPYAFVGPGPLNLLRNPQWFDDKLYWAAVSSGAVDVPYMIQWAGTPAYTFVLQAMLQWGMGPALGICGLLGLAVGSIRLMRGHAREREGLLVLAWTLLNLVYFGGQFAKFLRYLLPAYFGLAIVAAYFLLVASEWLARMRRWELASLQRWLAPAVISATAAWAVAFSGIYDQAHSRIQASQWIYANIPSSATLATEHWDDRLPLGLPGPGRNGGRYTYAELALYDPETPAKRTKLEAALDQSEYIILASRRLADSIPRLPERYPLAITYYRLLQSGQLGFERVARFQVEPRLGPLAIDDSRAQEDFTVYDHPLVEIWHKTPEYASASMRQQLDAVQLDRVVNVRAIDGGKGALLQTPGEQAAQVGAGTWSQLFGRDDLSNTLPVPVWLLAAEILALSSLPLLWRCLPFLPDRGFGASKIVGLAMVSYLAWLAASLKLAPFQRPELLAAWAVLALASGAVVWRKRLEFRRWAGREAPLLWITEGVFLAGFGLFLFIRAANPDLWHPFFGGEKPMNFAYLNAVTKSDYFPPYDPWFAGGIINYYYFGFVLVATLIKLTGILPALAFNLAQPTLFGALCAGTFSLAFGLSVPLRGRLRRGSAYVAGCVGVVLVGILGNLDAGLQLLDQFRRQQFGPLDFWRSTRFIGPEEAGPIHEFPYFTWLYGDLHAHQIALPITVVVLLVGLNLLRSLRADPTRIAWPTLILAGWLVAMLRATNTWDFPPYAAIVVLAVGLGAIHGLLRLNRRAIQACIGSLIVFGVFVQIAFLPYLQRYQLFYTGVDPVKAKTALNQYLTIHGLFLFLGVSLFSWYLLQARRRVAARRHERALVPEPGYYGVMLPLGGFPGSYASTPGWIVGIGVAFGLLLALAGFTTRGAIVFGIAAAVAACVAHWRQSNRAMQAALFGVALFATLVPEFVALQGDVGRMNTVFKFYLQAWVLFSVSAAVAFGWLIRSSGRDPFVRAVRPAWGAVAAILVCAALAYPLLASQSKIGLRFAPLPLSVDGMQFMDFAQYRDQEHDLRLPADAKAIRWLQDTVVGTPVVLEGRSPVYRWGSRISIYTGLPTILGWDVHQGQQRAGFGQMVQERALDVERAYASTSPQEALSIVRKYNVRWIVVGSLERAYYPEAGLDKFRTMPELQLAYDVDGIQLYEVTS